MGENLFIIPPVSKNELPALYNEVDMGSSFVINIKELWSNSANKFFDTLAAGRPILINHLGWQSEVIRADNLGYVLPFDLGNETEVLKFIKYSRDKQLIKEQRGCAKRKAEKSYSLSIAMQKYVNVIEMVVK